jgi:Transposase IS4
LSLVFLLVEITSELPFFTSSNNIIMDVDNNNDDDVQVIYYEVNHDDARGNGDDGDELSVHGIPPEFVPADKRDIELSSCQHGKELTNASKHVIKCGLVDQAYEKGEAFGLFALFITKSWMINMWQWTNRCIQNGHVAPIPQAQFLAYFRLEIAMTILQMNDKRYYWKLDMVIGHDDFKPMMSQDDFMLIQVHVALQDTTQFTYEQAVQYPLCHCRIWMEYFKMKSAEIAVPLGMNALNDASCCTKARTTTKSCITNKPDKYAIRFYAVVSNYNTYLHGLLDNRSGNRTGISGTDAYCMMNKCLKSLYDQLLHNNKNIEKGSPTALWTMMMAQRIKIFCDPSNKQVFLMDNYYARHILLLARALKMTTQDEARIVGTIKFTNIDAKNRPHLTKAITLIKNETHGSWKIVRYFDKVENLDHLHNKHVAAMRNHRQKKSKPFIPPTEMVSDCAGYIIWLDSQ